MSNNGVKYGLLKLRKITNESNVETVRLSLFEAKKYGLGTDNSSFVSTGSIAEAKLSMSEFASAITSMAVGCSIPVELKLSQGDKEEVTQEDIDKFLKTIKDLVKDVQTLLNEKTYVGKKDRRRITEKIVKVAGAFKSSGMLVEESDFNVTVEGKKIEKEQPLAATA